MNLKKCKANITACGITLLYTFAMIFLYIEFPLTMSVLFLLFIAYMLYLIKIAPYGNDDEEPWLDLCKE